MNDNSEQPGPSSPRDPTWDGTPLVDRPYYETPPMPPPQPLAGGQAVYEQQPYGVPPLPGYMPPQPKKSLRWLWITLSILGGLLILSCVTCSIAGVASFRFFQETLGPAIVAQQYYQAFESQDYNRAYSYVDANDFSVNGQQTSQSTFIGDAELADQGMGPVSSASYTGLASATDTSNTTVTMMVKRGSRSYEVQVHLKNLGNNWKIINVDRL